jgi:ribonuclease Z
MVAHPVAFVGEPTRMRDRTGIALDDGKLKVTAIEVNHSPIEPAYAYRFDYLGRSIVISGDTVRHSPPAKAAQGADVLFHEAQPEHVVKTLERFRRTAAT